MASTTAATTSITTIMATATITTPETAALHRLLSWSSPAYPTGGFAYSHGLEAAAEAGAVTTRETLIAWLETLLRHGSAATDAALLAQAWRAMQEDDAVALDAVAELAFAWRGTAETALESTQQGDSFASVTIAAWPEPRFVAFAQRNQGRLTHAVCFGAAAACHGVALHAAVFSWLAGFSANIVSAGVRAIPLGQTDGQRATAALLPALQAATAAALAATDPDQLGSATPIIEGFSMRHETQYTRLFRS